MSRIVKLLFACTLALLGVLPALTAQAQTQPQTAFELKMLSRGLVVDGGTAPEESAQEPVASASNWSLTCDLGRENWGGGTVWQ